MDKALEVICPINHLYKEGLDFCTYCLAITLSHYDNQVAWNVVKWAKILQVQMGTRISDHSDVVSIISLLSSFTMPCDTNGIYEGAVM